MKLDIKNNQKYYQDIVQSIKEDFAQRREERRSLEQQWKLNINYLLGNQYCEINPKGELVDEDRDYYWQNTSVYNHIAPILDTRMAKLSKVRPRMSVRAAGGEDKDLKTAKTATEVLNSTYQRLDLDGVINSVTSWSEATGTGFYKILWDSFSGKKIGQIDGSDVYEGDVKVDVVPPFEIFPDSLFHEEIEDCKSIIHARCMDVGDIMEKYGVEVLGEDIDVFSFTSVGGKMTDGRSSRLVSGVSHSSALVIEKYEKPSKEYPNGRVITIAGDKILYMGELPYINGTEGRRAFPFAKQISLPQVGCFFGVSVVERIIPLQRAYNAIKNRKNEFLNRISMGVIAVEDGSVDADELREEGMSPGKIIIYRQGSTPPKIMSTGGFPNDLGYEEDRLQNEFVSISGVSEVSRTSSIPSNISSGVALQLLIEQDDTRVSVSGEYIRRAIRVVARHIIRLFKQFATDTRIMRAVGDNSKAEAFYFNSSDLTSDDVVFDTENDISFTPAQKRSNVYDLLTTGLLTDDDGKMNIHTKRKLLEILGYGSMDSSQDINSLHISKACAENLKLASSDLQPDSYDDHALHITEHIRFLLTGEGEKDIETKKRI